MQGDETTSKRPYSGSRRIAAREANRARVVAAAGDVLRQEGWAGFSLEAVARAAGVTRLTVYNQFGSRRALLEALFDIRAISGGFSAIPAAMGVDDPHEALARIAAIFAGFWSTAGGFMPGLVAEIAADSEFAESMRARNERRRRLMTNLVGRMVARGDVAAECAPGLIDTLFALTSFPVYAELSAGRLTAEEVGQLLADLCAAAVARCRPEA